MLIDRKMLNHDLYLTASLPTTVGTVLSYLGIYPTILPMYLLCVQGEIKLPIRIGNLDEAEPRKVFKGAC